MAALDWGHALGQQDAEEPTQQSRPLTQQDPAWHAPPGNRRQLGLPESEVKASSLQNHPSKSRPSQHQAWPWATQDYKSTNTVTCEARQPPSQQGATTEQEQTRLRSSHRAPDAQKQPLAS